jgi:hypothetical protein
MFAWLDKKKQIKLTEKLRSIADSDCDRTFKGIFKTRKSSYVGIIILNCPLYIMVELYDNKPGKSTISATAENDTLVINDINMRRNNAGYGSIAMEALLDYAKEQNYHKITGWLSSVDQGHFDRLEHFYKKFGFDVIFNSDKTEGNVYLKF